MRIAVLVSGEGTHLVAIRNSGIKTALVVTDVRRCPAAGRARRFNIPTETVERTVWGPAFEPYRQQFTRNMLRVLKLYEIELVVMAGFKTILGPEFFTTYKDRVLNIHPSRLPDFKGQNAVRDTLNANPRPAITGSTVHVATENVDDGRILHRSVVAILPKDTVETLTLRLKKVEHKMYPALIRGYIMEIKQQTPAR